MVIDGNMAEVRSTGPIFADSGRRYAAHFSNHSPTVAEAIPRAPRMPSSSGHVLGHPEVSKFTSLRI